MSDQVGNQNVGFLMTRLISFYIGTLMMLRLACSLKFVSLKSDRQIVILIFPNFCTDMLAFATDIIYFPLGFHKTISFLIYSGLPDIVQG